MKILFPILAAALLAVGAMTGCTRGPSSAEIGPPEDPEHEAADARAREVLNSPDLQLGEASDYVIGPGDVISLTMVGRPEVLNEDKEKSGYKVTVSASPNITLPMIGAIRVHGKTAAQLQDELRTAYTAFIQNPVPIVSVERLEYNQVNVLGAVNEPGRVQLEPGDTLAEAIFKAGGLSMGGKAGGLPPGRYLKIYREKVGRKERSDLTVEQLLDRIREQDRIAPRKEILVPIEQFIFSGELDYNIPLRANDIVYVPPAGAVIVHGPVRDAGVTFLGPSLRTLSQVLTERRGLRFGAASRIELVRTFPDGTRKSYFLNGRRILARQDRYFMLQDNDQVFVYRNFGRSVLESFGSIFRAGVSTGAQATYNPVQ